MFTAQRVKTGLIFNDLSYEVTVRDPEHTVIISITVINSSVRNNKRVIQWTHRPQSLPLYVIIHMQLFTVQ